MKSTQPRRREIEAQRLRRAEQPGPPRQTIFQGGDGRTTEAIAADEVRQIQAVARLRGEQHGVWVRNFTERETPQAPEEILPGSGNGCLDGGWRSASGRGHRSAGAA